jgi:hypothetical protein
VKVRNPQILSMGEYIAKLIKTPDVETPGETKTPHEILFQLVIDCNQLHFLILPMRNPLNHPCKVSPTNRIEKPFRLNVESYTEQIYLLCGKLWR